MRFDFTDEQRLWFDTVHRFIDTDGGGRDYIRACDVERRYPYELYEKVARQGWLGLMIPEAYGGMGADAMFYAIFMGAMGKYNVDVASAFGVSTFTANNIVCHGTDAQKKHYLPLFIEGKVRFSISMTEPNAGSDVASLTTRAELKGDRFVLNGQKLFASAAHVRDNVICMAVRTDPAAPKHKGISLLLVPNTTPGLEMRLLPTLARHATGTNEIFLSNAEVPRENLLGELNHGWQYLVEHLEIERLAMAAAYAACAETAANDALRYAKERHQFGRPIGEFQAIKHMLADMHTQVEAANLMVYRLAYQVCQGRPCAKEAAMAKLFTSETLLDVATKGMQILGGYAQLPEFDMERYWREGKQSTVGGGTSQIQRGIIARNLGL